MSGLTFEELFGDMIEDTPQQRDVVFEIEGKFVTRHLFQERHTKKLFFYKDHNESTIGKPVGKGNKFYDQYKGTPETIKADIEKIAEDLSSGERAAKKAKK